MKKRFLIVVLAIFLFSLVYFAVAQDQNEQPTATAVQHTPDSNAGPGAHPIMEKVAANIAKRNATQVQFAEKRDALIEKLRSMDPEKIRRLEALSNVQLEKIAGLNKTMLDKIAVLSIARQNQIIGLNGSKLLKALEKIKIKAVKNADALKDRILTKEQLQLAKDNFQNAKAQYQNATNAFKEARQKYLNTKNTTDPKTALQNAKTILLKSTDAIINYLEQIKAKINENENLNESTAKAMIDKIDAQITDLSAIKDKIQAATTKDEIKSLAKDLREKWKDYQNKGRVFAERVVSARVQGVVNQAEVLEKKLENALSRMQDKGVNVSVSAEMEQFSQEIENAKDYYQQAQQKLEQARNSADNATIQSLVKDANSLLSQSRDSLKAAHETLKQIVSKIRAAGQELKIDQNETVDIEDSNSP
jgi:hypothetical protein